MLWERGLWVAGMTASDKDPANNCTTVLRGLPDFKNERSSLQHVVESRGHILVLSPKFHPEVAGLGIEYSWGMSKMKFRREINDEVPENLDRNNIRQSMNTLDILYIGRIRRFARRTRDYCRAYEALAKQVASGGKAIGSKAEIEKMRKICKAHRSIIDMEPGFIGRR